MNPSFLPRLVAVSTALLLSTALAAAPEPESTDAYSLEVLDETDTTRTVRHALGESEIPKEAERVISLSAPLTDRLLALDVTPYAVTTRGGEHLPYLAEALEGVKSVGEESEPNLEAILALEPDLILGSADYAELYPQLSAVAPTVLIAESSSGNRVEELLGNVALVVGKEMAAAAWLEVYEERVAEVQAQLHEAAPGESAIFVRVLPRELRLYSRASAAGQVLYDLLGFETIPAVPTEETWASFSLEAVPELSADHIFLWGESGFGEGDVEGVTDTSLWQSLPAVQQNQVYTLEGAWHWIQGTGVLARLAVVEDVREALGE